MCTHMKKPAARTVHAAASNIRVVEVGEGFGVNRMRDPTVVARSTKLGVLSVKSATDGNTRR
jgi:hypothetical protein